MAKSIRNELLHTRVKERTIHGDTVFMTLCGLEVDEYTAIEGIHSWYHNLPCKECEEILDYNLYKKRQAEEQNEK